MNETCQRRAKSPGDRRPLRRTGIPGGRRPMRAHLRAARPAGITTIGIDAGIPRSAGDARRRSGSPAGSACGSSRARRARRRLDGGGRLVPAAVALALFRSTGRGARTRARRDDRSGRRPRSGSTASGATGPSASPTGQIRADDELAFAYSNTAGQQFLLIFGVDEHRHVYWFHPAWRAGEPPPAAVRASAGPGPYELPEAVRHRTDGRQLTIYALLARQRIDVRDGRGAIRAAPGAGPLPAAFGAERPVVVGRSFAVLP